MNVQYLFKLLLSILWGYILSRSEISFPPHPPPNLLFYIFVCLIIVILMDLKQYFTVVLLWISLMINVQHIFICLMTVEFLWRNVCSSLLLIFNQFFSCCKWFVVLFIVLISISHWMHDLQIFSHSVGCLFIPLTQVFLCLLYFYFYFYVWLNEV